MFRCGYKIKFLFIGVLLYFFTLSTYAASSLNDYPQIKNHWDDGELSIAISKLKDVAKDKPKDDEIFELLKKVTFQKSKLDQWINKGTKLLKQKKFDEAKNILDFAKVINPNYKPYVTLMDEIKITQDELKYPSRVVFDEKSFYDLWKPYEKDGKFSKYGKFDNSTLVIDVPERHGWARIGIESNETIIDLAEAKQSLSHHLKFKFDPKNTTGFSIDLEGENFDEKSRSRSKISIVYKVVDAKSPVLELYKDAYLHSKLELNTVPEFMKLIVQPNNYMYLHLPDGKYLQTTSIKYPMPTKGYKVKVYSKARVYKSDAKMALMSIALREVPFKKKKEQAVIFDGKYLEGVWKPYQAHKYHFSKYSKFENNTLLVDVPEKNGWGQVGIESSDTVIDLTDRKESLSYHLKFKFDPENTTGFGIDLEGENLDKSHSFHRLQVFYKNIDEKSAILELHKDGSLHTKLDINGVAPDSLKIVIQPNNMMYLYLPDGRYLQTTSIKYPMPTKGYKLKIYSKPKERHLASKMSLKSIELKKHSFKKRFDSSNLGGKEGNIVLFDGKHLEERWIPYNEQYKDYFKEYALFDDNKLIIDIPKDHKWGEAGIVSPEPLVWLDRLGKDGEIKTTFSFDPLETSGFTIAAGGFNRTWKTPWGADITLSWTKVPNKDISKLRFKIDNKLLLDENLTAQAPSTITLSFKNGQIGIDGDTFDKKTFEWPHLVENRALHLWAFSRAYKKKLPVKMALKRVELVRKFGTPLAAPKPVSGVEILPEKEIYGSKTIDNWECYQTKIKGKEGNCTLSAAPLHISIKKGEKSTFGMKSKEKIVDLDRRKIKDTPLKMVIHFNPKKTDHFYIYFDYHYLSLEKKNQDTYVFKWGKQWARNIDAKWLENEWNGKVNITMAKDWTEIELDRNIVINRPDKVGDKRHLTLSVSPLNTKMKNNASLELKKITKQWLVPDGMTAVDRWNFMDDEDFDPEEFLREIRGEK